MLGAHPARARSRAKLAIAIVQDRVLVSGGLCPPTTRALPPRSPCGPSAAHAVSFEPARAAAPWSIKRDVSALRVTTVPCGSASGLGRCLVLPKSPRAPASRISPRWTSGLRPYVYRPRSFWCRHLNSRERAARRARLAWGRRAGQGLDGLCPLTPALASC